tara:strand:+ start:591 stop:812 length:222 start_codon:yes stop_codon:yes gene_type:complete
MAPFQTTRGIRYEVVTVHLIIGENSTPRYTCFVVPMLHEEIMFWLCNSVFTTADFTDERKAGLAAEILKFVED